MKVGKQNKKSGKNFFYKYYRVIVIPAVFLVYLSSYYFLNPYRNFEEEGLLDIDQTFDIFIILVYCAILTELTLFVGRKLNYYISWEQNPVFRAIAQFICLIAGNMILNYLFRACGTICILVQHCRKTNWLLFGSLKLWLQLFLFSLVPFIPEYFY